MAATMNTAIKNRLRAMCIAALMLAPLAHAETATLQHDNSGNVTQRTTPLGTTTYQYDALDRLTDESGPAMSQSFNYDANGNRLKDGPGSVNNYTVDPNSNRTLTTPVGTVTHDAAGNLTADGLGRTFFFNQAGQLYQVKLNGILIATYTYDYRGLRISKVTTASAPQGAQTIVYLYDQWNRIMEEYSVVSGNATLIRSYLWRNDTPVAQIDRVAGVDKFLYYEVDQLNTPRAATDQTAKVVWRWESDAFGTTLPNEDVSNSGSKTTINLRFGGMMYYDQESRLFYAMTRYYSPALGEFIQPDHLDLVRQAVNPMYAGYSQPLDLRRPLNQPYTYTSNNPMSQIDPLGLAEICSKFPPFHTPHTFLCVGATCSGKYPDGPWYAPYNPFNELPGKILDDSQNKSSASCSDVPKGKCDQSTFDQCIAKRIAQRGSSGDRYSMSTNNCGQWAEDVIQQCRKECTAK
jgi:RHS repeat-associated protein